jgi:hypothetical protein
MPGIALTGEQSNGQTGHYRVTILLIWGQSVKCSLSDHATHPVLGDLAEVTCLARVTPGAARASALLLTAPK